MAFLASFSSHIRQCQVVHENSSVMDSDDDCPHSGCPQCGLVFTKVNHLIKHSKVCGKHDVDAENCECSDNEEGSEVSDEMDREDDESDGGENNEELAFESFKDEALNLIHSSEEWKEKVMAHVQLGEGEEKAVEMVDAEYSNEIGNKALKLYRNYLIRDIFLMNGPAHAAVRETMLSYWDDGYSAKTSFQLAIAAHKPDLEVLLDEESEDEKSHEMDSDTDMN